MVDFEHDAMGNVTEVSPPGRPAHVFTYTKRNQLETYVLPDVGEGPATQTRFYDADRRLERIVRPDGLEIELVREPLMNRLQALSLPRGDLSFTYRPDGKPATVTTFDGQGLTYGYDGPMVDEVTWTGTVSGRVEKTYDDALRLDSLRVEGAPAIVHAYDDDGFLLRAGALTAVREPDTGRLDHVTVGALTTSWTYTPFGEIESVTTRLGNEVDGEVINEESFLYDRRGWITDKTATRGRTTVTEAYGYDPRGRLETVHEDGVLRSTFGYDANSNRISYDGPFGTLSPEDIRHDGRDRLERYGDAVYTHTESGEPATKTVGDQTLHFDIDVMGNLRRVDLPSGFTIEYLIDGAQRRVGKKVDGVLTHAWLYRDDLRPIAELDSEGTVVSLFVYATRKNVPDVLIKNGTTYRILSDHLGSPRLVVDAQTGAVAQELRYDAFGRVTLDTQPGFQPFGFAGGLYDPHTGLVRFGARDYDPEVGRWTTPDPIGFRGGQSNLYAYAGSNPINFIDPSGLETVLGIHTDVGANAGMGQGHAWISVSDGDTGTVERVGLYPEDRGSALGLLTDQNGDSDLVPEDPIKEAEVSRYYLLDDAQRALLDDLLDDSYEWMPTFNCASFASDVVRKVAGEDVDADDWLGIETPRELARSLERLNGEAPRSGPTGGGSR